MALASQRRRLQQVEDMRRDLLGSAANAAEAANHRMHTGVATDEDIDSLTPEVSSMVFVDLDQAFATDGRSWEEQLAAAPAARLALDAASCGDDRAALHAGLRALRHLAATGQYRTTAGWKRAAPPQRTHARILLRRLVQTVISNDAQTTSPTLEDPTADTPAHP